MFIDIFTALAVVVSVGLLFGILLALFIHLFEVDEDEKTKKIREILPGINCGACGFKGCADYADAIAKGESAPNLCIPGAKSAAVEIGNILGIKVEEPKDYVAFVHCNGTCDASPEKVTYEGIATCRAKTMTFGGPKSCSYGCLGCGDCAGVCVSNAICIKDGIARVDTSRCVGCGMCAKECPKGIISMIPQEVTSVVYCSSKDKGALARKACSKACIACKKCEKACRFDAVTVIDNCAVIDYSKCTGCGLCAAQCPTGCLVNVKFPDAPESFIFN